jgi:hypothetical protein
MKEMARDAELDRLKDARDRAFQRKQMAYQAMDAAWKRRSAARERLDHAHAAKQSAYEVQDAAWQDLQRLRDRHGPRIEWLNRQQENAYQSMCDAFDRASAAHDARDGASARMYADQGHDYKAESQGYVAERRQLIQELRDAKERHEEARPAFQYAKSQFDDAKRDHDRAKAEHERKREEFRQAKKDFDSAVQAFKKRLEAVREAGKQVAKKGRLAGRWYSKYMSSDGSIQILLDKNGNVTDQYPHVHVIHDEPGSEVRIHVTRSEGRHSDHEVLPGNASGNEVNAAIERALRKLRRY